MTSCNTCAHHAVCGKQFMRGALTPKEYALTCRFFKNKADFVEVVFCKDCRNRIERNWAKCAGRKPNDFCSDGIRRFK